MMKHLNKLITAAGAAAAIAAGAAGGQDIPRDPYVPPAKRLPSAQRPAAGEALHQQALAKLKQRFDEADLDASGALTEAEARKAGLGYVARHFDQIDTAHSGKITFDDLRRYLDRRRREAQPLQP